MTTTLAEKNAARPSLITDAQKQLFQDEGYMLLERVVSAEHLQILRDSCQGFIDKTDAEMTAKGVERIGLNAKG